VTQSHYICCLLYRVRYNNTTRFYILN